MVPALAGSGMAASLPAPIKFPYACPVLEWLRFRRKPKEAPVQHRHGKLGEQAAKDHLARAGLRFLAANYRSPHGEIDLVFQDADCIAFVEVKTRSEGAWLRPAAAVNRKKKWRLSRTALHYMRRIGRPDISIRFDIVEVLLKAGHVTEVRHLPNAFPLAKPWRYQ